MTNIDSNGKKAQLEIVNEAGMESAANEVGARVEANAASGSNAPNAADTPSGADTPNEADASDAHSSEKAIENAKEALEDEEMLYELSDLFRIFADTTRLKVLYAMMAGDFSVSDLAEIVGVSQSAISHQLRTLKQARLVKFTRKGKSIHYSLCDDHVKTILDMGMSHVWE